MNWIADRRCRLGLIWSAILAVYVSLIVPIVSAGSERTITYVTAAQRNNLQKLTTNAPHSRSARVIFNRRNGTPSFIKVKSYLPKVGQQQASRLTQSENTARQFLSDNRQLLKLSDPDQELNLIRSWSDHKGTGHFKYQQMVGGIPIFGKQLIVHLDGDNSVYLLNGQFEPSPQALQTTPTITEEEAMETVRQHLERSDVSAESIGLVFFTKPDSQMVLTYKVEVVLNLSEAWTYFIDANDGKFVHRITKVRTERVQANGMDLNSENQTFNAWLERDGNYYLIDPGMPESIFEESIDYTQNYISPGNTYIFSLDNRIEGELYLLGAPSPSGPWDPAGVSAMVNIRTIHQYYNSTFGHNGWDDNYMNYVAVVHYDEQIANAGFLPVYNENIDGAILFGDGDGVTMSNLAGSLDITAHEFQHGVTEYTAALIYENQSGALNEAYSDLFTCMVDDDDWTVGEDVTIRDPGFVRDLADPTRGLPPAPLPRNMSEYRDLPNTYDGDYGGVHINMSIPSHAGYLMAEGLENSIGRDYTEQIWYRALTSCLTPESQFGDARRCTIQAAEDLYGPASTEVAVVQRAWDEVEVFDDETNPLIPVEITVSHNNLNFPDVSVGEQSTQTLTLRNSSEEDINISDIALDGSSSFSLSHDGTPSLLSSTRGMDIKVTYAPESAGSESATLSIVSDADIPTNNISITGNAIPNIPNNNRDSNRNGGSSGSGGCMINTLGGNIKSYKAVIVLLPLGCLLCGVFLKKLKRSNFMTSR
jgi:Zn-dependent metalloprotease